MDKFSKKSLCFLISLLLGCRYTYGYIDPGTGGLVLSNVWILIAGIFGFVFGFILINIVNPVKKWFKKRK